MGRIGKGARCHGLVAFCVAAASAFAALLPALAEPVAVNRGQGQGLLVNHRGNCYIILPQHVHGRSLSVTLSTAAPAIAGDATIFRTFAPAYDLSVGLVSPGLESRCTERWDDLRGSTDALLDATSAAQLTRIQASGYEEHVPMTVASRDYETLTATPNDPADAVYQGTSGAMLEIGGAVVGMAIQSQAEDHAQFLRIDHIKALLDRLLNAGSASARMPVPQEPATPAGIPGRCPSALPIATVTCSVEPVGPEFACSNLGSGGAARFAPGTLPVEITAGLAVSGPAPLRTIALSARAPEGEAAPPQAIYAEISSAAGARPVWRRFGAADMTPFGDLALENGAAPFADQVRIVIGSSWNADLPVQIDCLGFQ